MASLMALLVIASAFAGSTVLAVPANSRPRIIVCTDIGGSDYDDFQSMVYLLVHADRFDIEGLISSPTGGTGRKADILKVINCYAHDYHNLKTYSSNYPTPAYLRGICKQGAFHNPGFRGYGKPTPASKWIIKCAKQPDPRPLWILDWAGIDDVAQALRDDPAIASKIRVYFIGGPNKKWSPTAYAYIARNFHNLWMIEDNSTYRGWFVGGDQHDDWGDISFVKEYVADRGALGDFFAGLRHKGKMAPFKMGDAPAVAYMLGNDPGNPALNKSWGGQYVRAWNRSPVVFNHAELNPPTANFRVKTFCDLEIRYHLKALGFNKAAATMIVAGQRWPGFVDKQGVWHFFYSPKVSRTWRYKIVSTVPALNGRAGAFTSYWPTPALAAKPSLKYPNWWTDNPNPALKDGIWQGAKTISKWRVEFLRNFARMMERCKVPCGYGKRGSRW